MLSASRLPLHRLILSLSDALDQVHPKVADHQQRVAYIATQIARHMGYRDRELLTVFHAAVLHDIGLITSENRIAALSLLELERVSWHAEVGYELLRRNPVFEQAAEVIRYHHLAWQYGLGVEFDGREVPLASHMLMLADSVEIGIDRSLPILPQAPSIIARVREQEGSEFHPDCVDAFVEVAQNEAFWLDATSHRIHAVLLKQIDWPVVTIDEETLEPIAELFGRLVDAASPWTAVHSAGVAAASAALATQMHFSPRELHLMRSAGYLHDIGKLSIPTKILDKPGRLTSPELLAVRSHPYVTYQILDTIGGLPQVAEWASFHHERLDGTGYPFRLSDQQLTLGSRIMAVADVFTAMLEDRPHRKGMKMDDALSAIRRMADDGGLDAQVVEVLEHSAEGIDSIRQIEQAEYGAKQVTLANIIHQEPARFPKPALLAMDA